MWTRRSRSWEKRIQHILSKLCLPLFLSPPFSEAWTRSLEDGLCPYSQETLGRTCLAVTSCWMSLERWRGLVGPLYPHLIIPSCLRGTGAFIRAPFWIRKCHWLLLESSAGSSVLFTFLISMAFLFDRIPPAPGIQAPSFPPPSLSPDFNGPESPYSGEPLPWPEAGTWGSWTGAGLTQTDKTSDV